MEKIAKHDSWPIQPDILGPPLDLRPVDIGGRWGHGWRSARVVHLVCGFVVRRLGFGLPLRRSLLRHFRTEQGHCSACGKKMATYNDLCPCGETQTMSHIVESCFPTKLNGGLSRLHSVDAVSWLTSYDS